VPQVESTRMRDVENVAVLVSAREDAKGLIHKVSLLEGELVEACRAWGWPRRSSGFCLTHRLMVHDG
jgi:hypothetical protein